MKLINNLVNRWNNKDTKEKITTAFLLLIFFNNGIALVFRVLDKKFFY